MWAGSSVEVVVGPFVIVPVTVFPAESVAVVGTVLC